MSTSSQAASTASPGRTWSAIAVTVIGYNLLLALLIVAPAMAMAMSDTVYDIREITAVSLTGTLVAELIALGILLWWLRRQGRSLADLGWKRPTTVVAIAAAVIFGSAYAAFTLGIPGIWVNAGELSLFKIFGVVVGVISGVIEEIVFRGFVMTELERIDTPVPVQILISAVTFSLIHIGFDLSGVVITFLMGLVLATLYVVGRRSLTPVAIGHGLINAVIEPWLLLFIISSFSQMFGG